LYGGVVGYGYVYERMNVLCIYLMYVWIGILNERTKETGREDPGR
jgi:hypothetical protein